MVDYATRLKLAMSQADLSTQEFADRLGTTYHAVRKVLLGQSKGFSAANHAKACAVLKIDPDWLALGSGEMHRTAAQTQRAPLMVQEEQATYYVGNTTSDNPASQQLSEAIQALQQLPAAKLAEAHRYLMYLQAN